MRFFALSALSFLFQFENEIKIMHNNVSQRQQLQKPRQQN